MLAEQNELPFPRYVRKGQCKRCGWCCLLEDPRCPHLTYDGEEKATCLIHGEADRPSHCDTYPGNPPIQNPECGYYFIDTWENKTVKAGEGLR